MDPSTSMMDSWKYKMQALKRYVKWWDKDHILEQRRELEEINFVFISCQNDFISWGFSEVIKGCLCALDGRKAKLFKAKDERWHLKIWVIWVREGDDNTKYFHWYVDHRRIQNSIWDLQDDLGSSLWSQEDLEKSSKAHFVVIYKFLGVNRIQYKLQVIQIFLISSGRNIILA